MKKIYSDIWYFTVFLFISDTGTGL